MKSSWKRIWMLLSVLVLIGGVAACANGDDNGNDEPEEDDAPEQEIYFYNSEEWDEVYAHSEAIDELSEDPGLEATEDEDGWYYVTVEHDVLDEPLSITFNNGDGEESAEQTIDHPYEIYATVNEDGVYGSRGSAEDSTSDEYTTVYFYNEEGWDTVNGYSWSDTSTLTDEWPGSETEEADREDWHKIEVQNAEPGEFEIIFNNGEEQTGDIAIPDEDHVYVVFDGNEEVTEPFASFDEAEEGASMETTTLHFYNDQGWDTVEANASTPDETLLEDESATQDGDSNWWTVDVPVDIEETTFDVEFTDGDETSDTLTLDEDSSRYLNADADITYSDRTDVYFHNEDAWDDVHADVTTDGDNPEDFLTDVDTTQHEDSDWYTASIPLPDDMDDTDYSITFHDGDDTEAEAAPLEESGDRYFTMTADESYSTMNQASAWMDAESDDFLTINYYNSEGWDTENIRAYNWSEVEDLNEILGSWPGMKVEEDPDDSDWVTAEVPVDFDDFSGEDESFNMIFNNYLGEDDDDNDQTPDIELTDEDELFVAYNGNTYEDKAAAEEAMVRTEVSFYNTEDWDAVHADAEVDGESVLDEAEATQDGDTDWWTVEVPADIAEEDFDITFHDGDGNEASTATLTDGDPLVLNMDGISEYETRELTELYYEADTDDYRSVHFYNSEDWADLYGYTFGDDHGELYGTWPGSPLMETDDTDWYEIGGPINFEDDEFTIIFNDQDTEVQTEEVELTNNDDVFIVLDGETNDDGNYIIEKFDNQSDAEDAVAE